MGIKTYRPYTETRRTQTGLTFEEITTSKPYRPLLEPKSRTSGRNNHGELTIWHRAAGTSGTIELWTSNGIRREFRPRGDH